MPISSQRCPKQLKKALPGIVHPHIHPNVYICHTEFQRLPDPLQSYITEHQQIPRIDPYPHVSGQSKSLRSLPVYGYVQRGV